MLTRSGHVSSLPTRGARAGREHLIEATELVHGRRSDGRPGADGRCYIRPVNPAQASLWAKAPSSRLCTQEDLESESMQRWAGILREPHMKLHRKLWEWCYITETLASDGVLAAGRNGLGFAVGREPLVAQFAAMGAEVLASDLDPERAADKGWVGSGEHADSLRVLNERGLCPPDEFDRRVRFQPLDMNNLPDTELGTFDFLWSSCAFEHLGTLDAGIRFVVNAMRFLRPGGLAVHTTEFNVGSNDETIIDGDVVIYRQRDMEQLADELRSLGHDITIDFDRGHLPADYVVDIPPYRHDPHLKLHLMGFTTTSVGLAIRHG
jgi:SAM-dependent methyltransferase